MLWGLLLLTNVIAAGGSSVSRYRLPDSIKPLKYKLDLLTDLENFTFAGEVWILIQCVKETQSIVLHSKQLTILEADVFVKEIHFKTLGAQLSISEQRCDAKKDFHIISLDQPLTPDKQYLVYIPFMGVVSPGLNGYYRSSYFDQLTNTTRWLAVTYFEPSYARNAFPCFDEPEMKAEFSIKLGHKDSLKSISNMPSIKTYPMEEKKGWVWNEFEESVPMSTYLVAWIVSEFESKVAPKLANNVTFKIWARKEAINQVDFASQVGPKVLLFFEELFDVKYPLPKQDMVAIPDFKANAMENWGLITCRETDLLYEANSSPNSTKEQVAHAIAHELAHQWFGNLVTMKWWTDLWLSEGFATYVGSMGVEHVFPSWKYVQESVLDFLIYVYDLDSLKSSHPVSVTIKRSSEVPQIFDAISYKKGSTIIRMMHLFLGDSFIVGVSNYLNKYKFENAEQDDLWEALTIEAQKNNLLPKDITVKTIMDSWTLQTGFPILNVTRNYESGTATIEQSRYLKLPGDNAEENCWWVPLTYTTQQEHDFNQTMPKQWLSCPCEKTTQITNLPGADQWVIFNVGLTALSRVQYDLMNWDLIIQTLNSENYKSIGTINRAGLFLDIFEFANRGDLPVELAIQMTNYLSRETEYIPLYTGLGVLHKFSLLLQRTPGFGSFMAYMKGLLTPLYSKYNLLSWVPPDLQQAKLHRLVISEACYYNIADCRKQSKRLVNQWLKSNGTGKNNPISTDIQKTAICNAVKYSGPELWDIIWNRYLDSNYGREKLTILSALSCSRDVWILNRYLEWTIDESSKVRKQDSIIIFEQVSANPSGFLVAKDFLRRRIKDIYKLKLTIGKYLKHLAKGIIFEDELNELKDLYAKNKVYFNKAKVVVEQSMELAEAQVEWFKKYYEHVIKLMQLQTS